MMQVKRQKINASQLLGMLIVLSAATGYSGNAAGQSSEQSPKADKPHEQSPAKNHTAMMPSVFPSADIKWQDGPPSLPPGAKIAVLEGDPTKDGPFVFRVKVPDGYKIPPHTHPKPERVTIISGTFNLGMGDKFDQTNGEQLPAGTYGTWPPGMKHFVWVKGETIVQFHGDGPWKIEYVTPSDDPRNQKK